MADHTDFLTEDSEESLHSFAVISHCCQPVITRWCEIYERDGNPLIVIIDDHDDEQEKLMFTYAKGSIKENETLVTILPCVRLLLWCADDDLKAVSVFLSRLIM